MLSKGQLSRLQALQRPRGREESGEFLLEGVRLVEDLLATGAVPRIALVAPSLEDTSRGRELASRLRASAETLDVSDAELARVGTTETPQGVAVVARIPRAELAELHLQGDALVVVLDAVQDPGNFGTIVRCADAFGAAAVVTLPGTVDPWNPKSVRSAAGSSLRIPVMSATAEEFIARVRQFGGSVYGAAMDGRDVAEVAEQSGPVAIVLGNEGAGLSGAVRAICDDTIAIPIRSAESLNVGVAAGIIMYVMSRRV